MARTVQLAYDLRSVRNNYISKVAMSGSASNVSIDLNVYKYDFTVNCSNATVTISTANSEVFDEDYLIGIFNSTDTNYTNQNGLTFSISSYVY